MNEKRVTRGGARQDVPMYELKIVLAEIKPAIWRRLLVRGDTNLELLHAVLQVAMGWTNSHMHQFVVGDQRYADPQSNLESEPGEAPEGDETRTALMEAMPQAKTWFVYEYDFGDSWTHSIMVEKIHPPAPPPKDFAQCLAGMRAGPPDDCGGPPGYIDFLKAIKNPKHPEHEEMLEWIGGSFNPEACDLEKINQCLRRLKWPRTTDSQLASVLMARDSRG